MVAAILWYVVFRQKGNDNGATPLILNANINNEVANSVDVNALKPSHGKHTHHWCVIVSVCVFGCVYMCVCV